jgi:hypothetical protein
VGLRAGRRWVVLTTGDDERFVALATGIVHRGIQRSACLTVAVELGGGLRDGGRGVCATCGAFVEKTVDRAGEHHDGGEFADDGTDGHCDGGASDDTGPATGSAAGDGTAHRANHQAEGERQRRDGRRRHVRRFRDGKRRDEPGQCGGQQHDDTGGDVGRPLVALTQLTPFTAAEPRQRLSDSVGGHGNSKHLQNLSGVTGARPTQFGQADFTPPHRAITPVRLPEILSQARSGCLPAITETADKLTMASFN